MRKLLQTIACIGLSQVMLAGCAGTQSSLNISEENKVTPLIRRHLGYSRGVFISNTYERHPLSGWRMSLFQSKHILYIYIILINSILTHSP
jgi:hypothetical protein